MTSFQEALKANKFNEFSLFLVELVKVMKVHTYVELGVSRGYTFNKISPHVEKAIAVDITPMPYVARLPNVRVYTMSTQDFSKVWKDPIDFLFIDADHKKEAVLRDFYLFLPYVKTNTGLIALHDTLPAYRELLDDKYCSNAWEAVKEIKEDLGNSIEMLSIPSSWAGLTLVRKVSKPLLF